MGDGNKVEFLVAICALLTSVAAVYMAWDQGRVLRAQQHGSVYPVLQVDGYASNDGAFSSLGINVRNSGVGPALIESVALQINGEDVEGFGDYLDTIAPGYELSWSAVTGRALAAGETVTPIDMRWPVDQFTQDTLRSVSTDAQGWALKICYCSVFDRCWQTSEIGQSRASRVDGCMRGETDLFEDLGTRNLLRRPDNERAAATPDSNPDTSGSDTPDTE